MASFETGIWRSLFRLARIAPFADGTLTLTAGFWACRPTLRYESKKRHATRPVSFTREISGILTKRGCNGAACHGGVKGQGGLKLSANALYPADDYEWITKGGAYQVLTAEVKGERIPRIDLAESREEPAAAEAHHGDCRMAAASASQRIRMTTRRSSAGSADGARYSNGRAAAEPKISRLEVFPSMAIMPVEGAHRLLVTAHFSDGHTEDYTHQALYTSNDGEVASVARMALSARSVGEKLRFWSGQPARLRASESA